MKVKLSGEEKRLRDAEEASAMGRVEKLVFHPSNRVLWTVQSRKKGKVYLVIPGRYCSCTDYIVNVVLRGKTEACYHMMAKDIAAEKGLVVQKDLEDRELKKMLTRIFYSSVKR